MIWLLGGGLFAAVAIPHLLPRSGLAPLTGITIWLAVLGLRALLAALLVLIAVFYLSATELFTLLTRWCLHAVIPFFATHLGFSGHQLGDVALLLPGVVLGISLISGLFGLWRAARAVRSWLGRSSLGPGPDQSVIVGDPGVMVAAAGIRDPKIVVSTGALATLDQAELAAGLEHERGHIAHRHPYVTLLAGVLYPMARFLPGSRQALGQLRFHLERDADEYAVHRTGDPLALASVICKAARDEFPAGPALAGLAGHGVPARLRLLLDRSEAHPSRAVELAGRVLAGSLVALILLLAAATPALAQTGWENMSQGPGAHICAS